ncbi:MAG: HAD family hydrolase [Parachlamydiaceae bacterium]
MKRLPHIVKALLIDFDGTLVDSIQALWWCYVAFLEERGAEPTKEEFDSLIGPPLPEIIETLKRVHQFPESSQFLFEKYEHRLEQAYSEKVDFFPDALSNLKSAKDKQIKLGIVTSAPWRLLELFLTQQGALDFFDVCIAYSDEFPSKPSPVPYARALKALGLTLDEAIAVEDSKNGIKSACGAGLPVVQLGDMILPGATCVVQNWAELGLLLNLESI